MPIYQNVWRYMPKIVAQLKMHQEIAEKVRTEEQAVRLLRELLWEAGRSALTEFRLRRRNHYLTIYQRGETETDRLMRKDKLPLQWKPDDLVNTDDGKYATRAIYAVNNAYFSYEEPDGE